MTPSLQRIGRELFFAAFAGPTGGFDDWVLDRLLQMLEEHPVRARDVLWSAGRPLEYCYFMRNGRVRLSREGAPPWTFEGRWFLGGFEERGGVGATRTAVALEDFDALRVERRGWFRLLEDSFALTQQVLQGAATTVATLEERVAVQGARGAPPRLEGLRWAGESKSGVLGRLSALADLDVARGAGVQALANLAAASEDLTLEQGEGLFRAGDAHSRLFLVAEGSVEATRREPDVTRRYFSGEIVGGAAAFCARIRDWDARATTATRLVAIPVEAWLDLVEEHSELAQSLMAVFARWRAEALDQLAEAAGPGGVVLT